MKELIDLIDEPQRSLCHLILQDNQTLFATAPAPSDHPQSHEGNYLEHVTERMKIAASEYEHLRTTSPLPFSLSDALITLFVYNIESPWKYRFVGKTLTVKPTLAERKAQKQFRSERLEKYGLKLTPEQEEVLAHSDDEPADLPGTHSLTSFCHMIAHRQHAPV